MLKVGVAGLGVMGKHHLRILSELPEVGSVSIYDINGGVAEELAAKYGAKKFSTLDEMIESVDAVIIATPTSTHKELALKAIERKKHLLVEKPLAESSNSAREIITKANRHGVKLMVGHVERFNPVIKKLKSLLKPRKPLLISITRVGPFPPRIKDSGVILDLAIHDIDILNYLLESNPERISCYKSSFLGKYEDSAVIIFKFDEVLAQLSVNWLTPFKVRRVEVATSEEYFVGDLMTQKLSMYSRYTEEGAYVTQEIPVGFAEPLREELKTFINSILKDEDPSPKGEEALNNIIIAEKCLKCDEK